MTTFESPDQQRSIQCVVRDVINVLLYADPIGANVSPITVASPDHDEGTQDYRIEAYFSSSDEVHEAFGNTKRFSVIFTAKFHANHFVMIDEDRYNYNLRELYKNVCDFRDQKITTDNSVAQTRGGVVNLSDITDTDPKGPLQ